MKPKNNSCLLLGLILTTHIFLLSWMASADSPSMDEMGHLTAGLSHWKFGEYDLYRVNPPLIRFVGALPVFFAAPKEDWSSYEVTYLHRADFDVGRNFLDANPQNWATYFLLSRLAVIPFSLLGAWTCYRWSSKLYGPEAAMLAMALWCFSPTILGWGHTLLPDVGAASLALLACYLFSCFAEEPSSRSMVAVGLALGFALASKTTLVFLPIVFVAYLFVCQLKSKENPNSYKWSKLACIYLLAMVVLNGCYGFEGFATQLKDFRFVSAAGTGNPDSSQSSSPGNRFSDTAIGSVPIPLPRNYVLGIDYQKSEFEKGYPSFLLGETKHGGWYHYYLFAFLVKTPIALQILLLVSLLTMLFKREIVAQEGMLIGLIVSVFILVSSQSGFNHHFRYVLPALPFVFVLASRTGNLINYKASKAATVAILLLVAMFVVSSLAQVPHSIGYFNEVAGGQHNGYRLLRGSNCDYGQDGFYMKRWLKQNDQGKNIFVAESHYGPSASQLQINYPLPPFQFGTHTNVGKLDSGTYVIAVSRLENFEYLRGRDPDERIGSSVLVYRIGQE